MIKAKILALIILMFFVVATLPTSAVTFDNSGGGSWQYYTSFQFASSASEYAQYKIVITGSRWELFNSQGLSEFFLDDFDFWNSVKTDGSDIRVYDQNNNQLYFWLELFDYANQQAVIWVNLPANAQELNIAYGNPNALQSTYHDPNQVFEFFDDFSTDPSTRYTETADTGSGYFTWDQTNLRLKADTGGTSVQAHYTHNTFVFADGIIEMKIISGKDGGFTFRFQNQNNLYVVVVTDSTAQANTETIRIYKRVAGTWTQIGGTYSITNPAGSEHMLKFKVQGTLLTIWWDGNLVVQDLDLGTDFSSGKIGARLNNGVGYWDDIIVYKLADPVDVSVGTHGILTTISFTTVDPSSLNLNFYITSGGMQQITFSVTTDKVADSIEWKYDGTVVQTDINTDTSSYTHTFYDADGGQHTVEVIATNGTAQTSNTWKIYVQTATFSPTTSVVDLILQSGSAQQTFSVTISISGDVTWKYDGTSVQTDFGVTSSSYTLSVTQADIGQHTVEVIISNWGGQQITNSWTVNVNGITYAPLSNTIDIVVEDGSQIQQNFSADAGTTADFTWKYDGTVVKTETGVTSSSYSRIFTSSDYGTHTVDVTVTVGADQYSNTWTVNVLSISYSPSSSYLQLKVQEGVYLSQTFSVTVNPASNVTWEYDGSVIKQDTSVTSSSVTLTFGSTDVGSHTLKVTTNSGTHSTAKTWTIQIMEEGVSSTGAIIPPLSDDPSLAFRYSFDRMLTEKYSFESSASWTFSANNGNGTTSVSVGTTTEWATDGIWGLKLKVASTSNFGYGKAAATKTLQNISTEKITFDYYYLPSDVSIFKVSVYGPDGVVIKTETIRGGTDKHEITVGAVISKIEFSLELVADSTNDWSIAYVDNVVIHRSDTVLDDTNNTNDGTNYGGRWVTGRYGYAMSFDGNSYVSVPDSNSLDGANPISVFALIKPADINSGYILIKNQEYAMYLSSGKLIAKIFGSGTNVVITSNSNIETGNWYFVGFTYDGQTIRLYINGELDSQKTQSVTTSATTNNLLIGSDGTNKYKGLIDELKIFKKVLIASEVKSMDEILRVSLKDESTGELINSDGGNVSILNYNIEIKLPFDRITKNAVLFYANMNTSQYGEFYLFASPQNYYPRKLIVNIQDGTYLETSMYFPSTSANVIHQTFTFKDPIGKYPPQDVILSIKKPFESGSKPVFQSYFDSSGKTNTYLILDNNYIVDLITPSETVSKGWITPDPSGTVLVELNTIKLSPSYTAVQKDVKYNFVYSNSLIRLIYTDNSSSTTDVTFNVYNRSGNLLFTSTVQGSVAQFEFNTTGLNDTYVKAEFVANSNTYGQIKASKYIILSNNFLDAGIVSIISSSIKNLLFGGFIIVLAYTFGYRDSYKGAVIISILAAILFYAQLIDIPWVAVSLALSYSILAYLAKSAKEWEGWS